MNLIPSVELLSLSSPRFGERLGSLERGLIVSRPALSDWSTILLMGGIGSFHNHANDALQAHAPKP